jgi:predicted ABC-type ATPase
VTAVPPLLWVIAGPNGAGKTTYYETRIRPRLNAEFVNADRIGAERWPEDPRGRAYDAARLARERRQQLLAEGKSLVAETVFSHPSKLGLLAGARRLGYQVWLSFICLESADLSVARVAERVARGGHDVPAEKIRQQFVRTVDLSVRAVALAHRAFVIDNSDPPRPLRDVALFERGELTWVAADLPGWCQRLFHEHMR